MSFLDHMIETEDEERARLASTPKGSRSHALSQLPVNISGWPEDLVVELPWAEMGLYDEPNRVVVVPFKYNPDAVTESSSGTITKRRRHGGWWDCIVAASTNPSYPVGGYRLSIPASEIARGKQIDIFALQQSAAVS